jgi:hypothetical protein
LTLTSSTIKETKINLKLTWEKTVTAFSSWFHSSIKPKRYKNIEYQGRNKE